MTNNGDDSIMHCLGMYWWSKFDDMYDGSGSIYGFYKKFNPIWTRRVVDDRAAIAWSELGYIEKVGYINKLKDTNPDIYTVY